MDNLLCVTSMREGAIITLQSSSSIILQVCQDFRLASDSVCKAKCLTHIPSDVFIELWEELGLPEIINYIEVKLIDQHRLDFE